jgi:hypothetical protein
VARQRGNRTTNQNRIRQGSNTAKRS